MKYVLHAFDYTDAEAASRRLAARPAHLEGVRKMKAEGTFHFGGALLDDHGTMIGSMMVVEFEDPADLDSWLEKEPYITQRVWDKVDVRPFKQADV